ncbi:DUF58 domain-containing protein [Halococcoides cellulosivorans]|uniref:DUF58 domain-containing protein n=1 Tax=Halococcoides cellulosivorans TaxID=1679096 RepID=A0A2R4WYD7_9EURY|nr:DUF58 domain-containing protein [Halococcoides cellulosivorans]AWB26546.1 hypothetical protein HARCEL1_01875 [Halococcoides cellulosivorans]
MIRPTWRGLAVAIVAIAAIAQAWAFGPRTLNAVAVPAVVALAVGFVQIAIADLRLDLPRLRDDHEGTTVTADCTLTGHRGLLATAQVDTDGVTIDGPIAGVVPTGRTCRVTLTDRGTATLGPGRAVVRDRMGLWRRSRSLDERVTTTVFPRVLDLVPEGPLAPLIDPTGGIERQEFDRVREYVPGDPLSDVHWASTAKRPDELYVVEFADRRPDEDVLVAASGPRREADAIAEATASVAIAALTAGRSVGLVAGDEVIEPGRGRDHRYELLTALAAYDGERTPPDAWANATVQVTDGTDGPRVTVGDATIPFDRLRADRSVERTPTAEGSA